MIFCDVRFIYFCPAAYEVATFIFSFFFSFLLVHLGGAPVQARTCPAHARPLSGRALRSEWMRLELTLSQSLMLLPLLVCSLGLVRHSFVALVLFC